MDRLTNKREADAQRENYKKRLAQGYPRNIPEERFIKLADYEDTGLEPGKIKAALKELETTREFIHAQGLEFALAECLERRKNERPKRYGDFIKCPACRGVNKYRAGISYCGYCGEKLQEVEA